MPFMGRLRFDMASFMFAKKLKGREVAKSTGDYESNVSAYKNNIDHNFTLEKIAQVASIDNGQKVDPTKFFVWEDEEDPL